MASDISDGRPWPVELSVRDLGGNLDFLGRVLCLIWCVLPPTVWQQWVRCRWGFGLNSRWSGPKISVLVFILLKRRMCLLLPCALFGAVIVRAVWFGELPFANTPVVMHLLDGPIGVDPTLHIVWARFRMMRRYLVFRPPEVLASSE